jgi:predicted Zn-dependent peptidase
MLHPVINQIGVDTQNEVVKEEKRLLWQQSLWTNDSGSKEKMFKTSLSLDDYWFNGSFRRRKIREFKDFNKKFYVPNNAVLVVAGDFNAAQTKNGSKNTLVR